MKRTRSRRPRQPLDEPGNAKSSRRRRVGLPIFLVLAVAAAISIDLWSGQRTFHVFDQNIPAAAVESVVVEPGATSGVAVHPPTVRTVTERAQVLHLLDLLSQARVSRDRVLPTTQTPTYLVYIHVHGEHSIVYTLYRIHRFPLLVIAVVAHQTYTCSGALGRALQTLVH